MSDKKLEEKVNKQKWTFAKTYAQTAPHEYFLKNQNEELFAELKQRIAKFGKEGKFFGHSYIYYHHGKYRY